MEVFDWCSAPPPWDELGPEIAEELKRIAEEPRQCPMREFCPVSETPQ
jgi:hypothetical protein